jgi:hypothetical protein
MTGKVNSAKEQAPGAQPKSPATTPRKPYAPPRITRHGSVIELTRGGGSVIEDGIGTFEGNV